MNFIVAVDDNYAIGKDNKLLYHLPSDLKYFKETTLNKVVVMGDKTYFSLPIKPLPKRINIVVSIDKSLKLENAIVVNSFNQLFEKLKEYNDDDVFVIGGATIYNSLMDYCKKAYITRIYSSKPADVFVNNIEKMEHWKLVNESEMQTENDLQFKFQVFENQQVKTFE